MANDLSEIDLKKINTLYNCPGFPHVKDAKTDNKNKKVKKKKENKRRPKNPLSFFGSKQKRQKRKPTQEKKKRPTNLLETLFG